MFKRSNLVKQQRAILKKKSFYFPSNDLHLKSGSILAGVIFFFGKRWIDFEFVVGLAGGFIHKSLTCQSQCLVVYGDACLEFPKNLKTTTNLNFLTHPLIRFTALLSKRKIHTSQSQCLVPNGGACLEFLKKKNAYFWGSVSQSFMDGEKTQNIQNAQ